MITDVFRSLQKYNYYRYKPTIVPRFEYFKTDSKEYNKTRENSDIHFGAPASEVHINKFLTEHWQTQWNPYIPGTSEKYRKERLNWIYKKLRDIWVSPGSP